MFPHFYFIHQKTIFFSFFFCFLPTIVLSQNFFGEFKSELSGGWWYYDQGVDQPGFDPDRGNAYTESTAQISLEGNMGFAWKKLQLGIGATYSFFLEDDMYGEGNESNSYNNFKISRGVVKFLQTQIFISYPVIDKEKYQLRPRVATGIFWLDTLHPDKNNFGRKTFWSIGMENDVIFKHFTLVIQPNFNTKTIVPKQKITSKEIHKIYNLGMQFGVRFNIFKLS